MSDSSTLQDHYSYWDDYVSAWFTDGHSPVSFLPEPWWGWTPARGTALHSVVLNLNPGTGGVPQTRRALRRLLEGSTYSAQMLSGALPDQLSDTNDWHNGRRARPVVSRIPGLTIADSAWLSHHLSIELCPLHDKSAAGVDRYVAENIGSMIDHTLLFAAEASRIVEGPLRRVVIVRCSARRFMKLFKRCGLVAFPSPLDNPARQQCFRFDASGFEDVSFICVWGARNHLPVNAINDIINHYNNQSIQ